MWNKHKQMRNALLVVTGKVNDEEKYKHKHMWNKHKQMRNVLLVVKGKVVEGDKHGPRRAHGPRLR